jgi:hypothetical protein
MGLEAALIALLLERHNQCGVGRLENMEQVQQNDDHQWYS